MTNYNELRDGQEFFANGYKKGYEDAKKEFDRPNEETDIRQAVWDLYKGYQSRLGTNVYEFGIDLKKLLDIKE